MAMILNGKFVADAMAERLASGIASSSHYRAPTLHIFRDKAKSSPFASGLVIRAQQIGINTEVIDFAQDIKADSWALYLSNHDCEVDGIIIDGRPGGMQRILPSKDVDHYCDGSKYRPAVSHAVMRLLDAYNYRVYGHDAVVIGKSRRVGLPIAIDLLQRGATVTVCHTATENLEEIVSRADLVVSCTGVKDLIKPSFIKPGAWVIDTGCDVDRECAEKADAITPRVGGVGPLTVTCALLHVIQAWGKANWRVND